MATTVRRAATIAGTMVTVLMLAAGPAAAGAGDRHRPPPVGGQHPGIPKDSGFYALESTAGSMHQTDECGATITVTIVTDQVKERDLTYANGDVKSQFKGPYVWKLSNSKNKKTVTLDNSGPYTGADYADGSTFYDFSGPGILLPFTPGEKAAYRKAGLPPIFYFAKGTLDLYDVTDSQSYVLRTPNKIVSVCTLLGLPDKYGSGVIDEP